MADFFNIQAILSKIVGFDSSGKDSAKVDTVLEYDKLSSYLNGTYYDEKTKSLKKFSKEEIKLLKQECEKARNELKDVFADETTLPEISWENAKEYAYLIAKYEYKEDITPEEKIIRSKTKQALYDFALNNGFDMDGMKIDECDLTTITEMLLKKHEKMLENKKTCDETLDAIKNPYDNKILEKSLKTYIKNNNIPPINVDADGIDLGNGEYDRVATQKTNLCWAHSGINSLLKTTTGYELIKNNSCYDKETGMFAIHLQEAENSGLHNGIYFVSPEDIATEGQTLSSGEGDVTAYMLAVKRYFEEVESNPELKEKLVAQGKSFGSVDDGNFRYRFFELVTGGKKTEYSSWDRIVYKVPLENGIGNGDSASIPYGYVYDIAKSGNGVVNLSIENHAISVIGTKDDKLLIQESLNNSKFAEVLIGEEDNKAIFNQVDDVDNAPTYEISKYEYDGYIKFVSYLKWK